MSVSGNRLQNRAVIVAVAGALVTIFRPAVQAQPSPSVRYLMNEPVSMLEWGTFKLEESLRRFTFADLDLNAPGHYAHVEYDWDKNQLKIAFTVYPRSSNISKSTPQGVCGSVIRRIRFHFGLAPGYEFMHPVAGIRTYFHHRHFTPTNVPKNLDEDLEAITMLEVGVWASTTDKPPFKQVMSCSSELTKSEIRYYITEAK